MLSRSEITYPNHQNSLYAFIRASPARISSLNLPFPLYSIKSHKKSRVRANFIHPARKTSSTGISSSLSGRGGFSVGIFVIAVPMTAPYDFRTIGSSSSTNSSLLREVFILPKALRYHRSALFAGMAWCLADFSPG